MSITADASPWGVGAFLTVNGAVLEYFLDPLTELDVAMFQHTIGDAAGQQTWECLAVWLWLSGNGNSIGWAGQSKSQ